MRNPGRVLRALLPSRRVTHTPSRLAYHPGDAMVPRRGRGRSAVGVATAPRVCRTAILSKHDQNLRTHGHVSLVAAP